MLENIFKSLRPWQWSKNVLVFAGLFFAKDVLRVDKIVTAVIAFVLFCLVSSSGYLFNDILDREKDKLHPKKRFRPIAAGKISVKVALGVAVLLLVGSLYFSYRITPYFGIILTTYFLLTLLYSLHLKRIIIIDVLIIASGFIFRAIGGTIAINESVSSWLIICTTFLALFFALNKRKAEFKAMGAHAASTRRTLAQYSEPLLDQLINTVTTACLISYALYTLDTVTVVKFGTRNLALTLPFVIYGLFRYLYLVIHTNEGESPEFVVLKDKPILACIGLYVLTVFVILYL